MADPVERDRATPRPWFLHDFTEAVRTCGHTPAPGDVTVSCDDPATITVATMGRALTADIDEARANAELIVTAVNAFDDLVAALEAAQEELRLIQMKDTNAVYNPMLRIQMALVLEKAKSTTGGR